MNKFPRAISLTIKIFYQLELSILLLGNKLVRDNVEIWSGNKAA